MDTLTVCFKLACRAYAFFMRVLCFMCQTHLFAQMLSESTNTRRTFCLPGVHPHASLLQTQTYTHIHTNNMANIQKFDHSHNFHTPPDSTPKSNFKLQVLICMYAAPKEEKKKSKTSGFFLINESLCCFLLWLSDLPALEFETDKVKLQLANQHVEFQLGKQKSFCFSEGCGISTIIGTA